MATYEAGHDLHTAEVAADRVARLARELELKSADPFRVRRIAH